MPLSQANADFMAMLAAMGVKPLNEMSADEARETMGAFKTLVPAGPDVARVEDLEVPLPGGPPLPVRVYVPDGAVRGVIVYFHGGGWVLGDLDGYDPLMRALANGTGFTVASVDYRLAPEHRYPTAVDDCTAAFAWIADNRAQLGADGLPLVVAGDSAGGNLAAVVARRARDTSGPQAAMQVLVYPVTDSDFETPCYTHADNQQFLDRDSMVWFWGHYAPDASRRGEPDASPLRAADLSGLPPALVITAEYDPLRDEGEAYAARLEEAGVPTTLIRHDGQMHGFFSVLVIPGHEVAIEQIADALTDVVGTPA
jgi:acetyl esterase